jgi:hypothetical protein
VDASLKARANAAEAYARGLADAAAALSPPLATTGLGIARTLHGSVRSSTGVSAAVRSAFNFLTGGSAGGTSGGTAAGQHAAAQAADLTFGGDDNESHASVVTGGYDSFHIALAVMRRSSHKVRPAASYFTTQAQPRVTTPPFSPSLPALFSRRRCLCRRLRRSWTLRSRSVSSPPASGLTRPPLLRASQS